MSRHRPCRLTNLVLHSLQISNFLSSSFSFEVVVPLQYWNSPTWASSVIHCHTVTWCYAAISLGMYIKYPYILTPSPLTGRNTAFIAYMYGRYPPIHPYNSYTPWLGTFNLSKHPPCFNFRTIQSCPSQNPPQTRSVTKTGDPTAQMSLSLNEGPRFISSAPEHPLGSDSPLAQAICGALFLSSWQMGQSKGAGCLSSLKVLLSGPTLPAPNHQSTFRDQPHCHHCLIGGQCSELPTLPTYLKHLSLFITAGSPSFEIDHHTGTDDERLVY